MPLCSRSNKRGHDARVSVNAAHEIRDGDARAHRRAIGEAGDAHDARRRLHGQIHRQIGTIRPADAITGRGGIDHSRIHRMQHRPADAEAIHRSRREILQQHVGALHHVEQQRPALLRLQIQA
jgi:hypothetical protein